MVESKVELKAAVESMKGDLLKEFATIRKAQAEEHSKALARVQVTKAETRTAGARRAAGVYLGQGTNASVTALTAEPPELGGEGIFEIFKFKEEVSSMKKRSTQTPTLQIPEEYKLKKFEEDLLTLAWVDELVAHNEEHHDHINATYLRGTVAGGTLDNANVAMNVVLCFPKNDFIDGPQQHTLTVLCSIDPTRNRS